MALIESPLILFIILLLLVVIRSSLVWLPLLDFWFLLAIDYFWRPIARVHHYLDGIMLWKAVHFLNWIGGDRSIYGSQDCAFHWWRQVHHKRQGCRSSLDTFGGPVHDSDGHLWFWSNISCGTLHLFSELFLSSIILHVVIVSLLLDLGLGLAIFVSAFSSK